jgi:hypothetical protein
MAWTPVQDLVEYVDYRPEQFIRVKKMIWNPGTQTFDRHYYIRIHCDTDSQHQDTMTWLNDQYGSPRYQGQWWPDKTQGRQIWLADSLATFWQLKWGDIS